MKLALTLSSARLLEHQHRHHIQSVPIVQIKRGMSTIHQRCDNLQESRDIKSKRLGNTISGVKYTSTTDKCPLIAAIMSAVRPLYSLASTSAEEANRPYFDKGTRT